MRVLFYYRVHVPMMNVTESKSSGLIFDDSVILRDVHYYFKY